MATTFSDVNLGVAASDSDRLDEDSHCCCCAECELCLGCNECPRRVISVLLGYEAFRGHPDGGWENNGINTGFNFGTRIGRFSDWTGIGMQIGGTIGVYDWSGTDYRLANQDQAEMQDFFT